MLEGIGNGWLWGLDLNQRPLGYEPKQLTARLCFSCTWMLRTLRFCLLFWGVLFHVCSTICSVVHKGVLFAL
jgi:hypothetical protein